MGLLTLLSPSGRAPPGLVSAIILANGTSLEVTFDDAIIAGSATLGFSRSVSSITSGAIASNVVTLTIPKAYIGDSVGTLTYSGLTGTLAGTGGFVASFGPVAITNNSTQQPYNPQNEYTTTNYGNFWHLATSSVFEDAGGTTAAADNGDVVGCVSRLRDPTGVTANLLGKDLAQTTTASKPTLVTSGGTYAKELDIHGNQSLWTNMFGSPGTQMANFNFTTGAWTMAFRVRGSQATTSGAVVFGADTDPRAGAAISRSGAMPQDTDVLVNVYNDQRVYDSLPDPAGWHTLIVTKTAGSGGTINLYVDSVAAPALSYSDASGSYSDNRVVISGSSVTSHARFRSSLFIDKVITDLAGLKSWLEA